MCRFYANGVDWTDLDRRCSDTVRHGCLPQYLRSDVRVLVAKMKEKTREALLRSYSAASAPLKLQRRLAQVSGRLTVTALLSLDIAGNSYEFEAERTATEVRRGQRPERRKVETPKVREPRGKPRKPGVDEKLEPIRRALRGEVALVISVDDRDQILECVEFFESIGVKPVLYGASDAWKVTDELSGRVSEMTAAEVKKAEQALSELSDQVRAPSLLARAPFRPFRRLARAR